jgi:carbamoylphosphate synthase large subunit
MKPNLVLANTTGFPIAKIAAAKLAAGHLLDELIFFIRHPTPSPNTTHRCSRMY